MVEIIPAKEVAPPDWAFRLVYPDKSAWQIYADGRTYSVSADGTIRDEPRGMIVINRIPSLIEKARQEAYANADCEPR